MQMPDEVRAGATRLRMLLGLGGEERIPLGVILGTGLSFLSERIDGKEVPFSDLPFFPVSTTSSHKGSFVYGTLDGWPLLIQAGRVHLYEGYSAGEVCMGVRVMASLGIHTLLVTNAAGALNPLFGVGNLFLATDQINMTGLSPLSGPNHESFGLRFPDMSRPFDPDLMAAAQQKALDLGIPLEKGVYIGVHGPELETPAETRMYRMLGADAIGMSSVLEVISARHLGLRVLALSSLANKNLPDCMESMSIEEIVRQSALAERHLSSLLTALLPELCRETS
ncbi:MAG: purine-nucleoside phosphorylase [Desulfovibrio sp.]|nr:purine-nucleoside phosphorylase [Desulfovibrio sp.]